MFSIRPLVNCIDIKEVTYGKKTLFILNDPPYGTERSCNILRLADALGKKGGGMAVRGTCMDARGLTETELADSCSRSPLSILTEWTQRANEALIF